MSALPEDLVELRDLLSKVTVPLPWYWHEGGCAGQYGRSNTIAAHNVTPNGVVMHELNVLKTGDDWGGNAADLSLIVAAVNALPTLLERVEAAKPDWRNCPHGRVGACVSFRCGSNCDQIYDRMHACLACTTAQMVEYRDDRDALAAKVARLSEQVAYLERSRDNICETAERDRGDALRGSAVLRSDRWQIRSIEAEAQRDANARKVAQARRWIETCVDPVIVGPMRKQAMLDYLDGKRTAPDFELIPQHPVSRSSADIDVEDDHQ